VARISDPAQRGGLGWVTSKRPPFARDRTPAPYRFAARGRPASMPTTITASGGAPGELVGIDGLDNIGNDALRARAQELAERGRTLLTDATAELARLLPDAAELEPPPQAAGTAASH
jgi:hypothetical protein